MTRLELRDYVIGLSGYSLQYFMLDKMDRDIDMECPAINKKDADGEELVLMWEDYIEEILDWLETREHLSSDLVAILDYVMRHDEERI